MTAFGWGARRRACMRSAREASSLALAVVTLPLAVPGTLRAAGLPDELVAAAALIPADGDRRRACLPITGLHDQIPIATVRPAPAGSPGGGYGAATSGIWLGDGPVGVPPPPLVQAMLDAGAAEALPVTWVERRRVPAAAVPRDAAPIGAAGQPQQPGWEVRDIEMHGFAYVVSGPERDLWRPVPTDFMTPKPLRVLDGIPDRNDIWSNHGEVPPGLKGATTICYSLLPDRVLEYEDPTLQANGLRELSAAVLFHPARMPRWASDYRTFDAMPRRIQPDVVMVLTFRWDGDGWRPEQYAKWGALLGRVHLVGQD